MRVDSKQKSACCGCTACAAACPHDAITMQADELGFLYPQIDDARCVDCGLCVKVCQFGADYACTGKRAEPEVYAARLKSEDQLARSQSGGAFYGMAAEVIRRGGVVYGAGFTGHFHVAHKRAVTLQELEELRGSKYVQSDMREVFPQVKADLRAGRTVLFSGTPCQVSGLQSYVGRVKLQSLLYTVDLVCHGVPSPAVWHDYLDYVEQKEGEPCTGVNFRDKAFGWKGATETFSFGKEWIRHRRSYVYMYFRHLMHRPSCLSCPFTNMKRCADVTVGDFWGWEKVSTEFNDNKGVSLVLVNSDKGHELWESAAAAYHIVGSNTTDCLQPQLRQPTAMNPRSGAFLRDYVRHGFVYVGKRYGDLGLRYRLALMKGRVARCVNRIRKKKQ